MKPFYLFLLLAALTLTSCASHGNWTKSGVTAEKRQQDYQECTDQATIAAKESPQKCVYEEGGYVFSSLCKRERRQVASLTRECMQGRGYSSE